MVGALSNQWDWVTTSKPLQTPFTASPVHRIPSEIPRCWRGLIPPDKPIPLGGPLAQVSPHSALHLLTQMGRSPPERLGTGERWGRGLPWRHSEAHLPCYAPGHPDILQSRSDRCNQINQCTAGKGSESSKSSETRSGLDGQRGATSEGARRARPRARPGCWCSDGSRRGPSPVGIFLSLLLAPRGRLSSPPSTGLLICELDGPHV